MRKHIANCFTLLNLVFGSMAVIQILQGFPEMRGRHMSGMEHMCIASLFICLAAVVDFLDGLIARMLGAASEMGKQLDSLADLVSFGLAPGLIIFEFLKMSFEASMPAEALNSWYLLPALILPCAGAFRLARFNLRVSSSLEFEGLPIPAGGILIASFPLIFTFNTFPLVHKLMLSASFWYAVIFLVSFLMVSTLPMMSMKFKNLSFVKNWPKFLLFVLAIIGAVVFGWLAVPLIFLVYILFSLVLLPRS